jgi:hypothetical protein
MRETTRGSSVDACFGATAWAPPTEQVAATSGGRAVVRLTPACSAIPFIPIAWAMESSFDSTRVRCDILMLS